MRGYAYFVLIHTLILAAGIEAAPSSTTGTKSNSTAQPPTSYANESANRILTVEWKDFGKIQIMLRSSWSPGSYGIWRGAGKQTEKGVVFTKVVEEGEDSGLEYLATVSQSKITVKVKPEKGKPQQGELVGVYHRISEEKITALAKKDSETSEKNMDEALKMAAKNSTASDKPAFAEWKRRWPELRTRLASLKIKSDAVVTKSPVVNKPQIGQSKPAPSVKTTAHWIALAEASAAGMEFIGKKLSAGVTTDWDGEFDDGFGGSLTLKLLKSGELEFGFRCTREAGSEEVYYAGKCPANLVKEINGGKEATAEFTDKNDEVKDSAQRTHVQFRRLGRAVLVEIESPRSFMSRAWLDGIYFKRPPMKAE